MEQIQIVQNVDLTTLDVDAIVLDANHLLKPQAGVSERIYAKANQRLADECDRIGFTDPGRACMTGSYGLESKGIIHVLTPQYGTSGAEALMEACYLDSVNIAVMNQCQSVAFMLLGVERQGWPEETALQIAKMALQKADTSTLQNVMIVF